MRALWLVPNIFPDDLPVISKTRKQLDSMELVPFRALFDAGVGSVMIAHLSIPSIDNTANRATSISKKSVTDLLRNDMGYQGLTFTDALEMKGVTKYFPGGTISVESLIAGNDMLCLPENVEASIEAIKKAIAENRLTREDVNQKVKKVLIAKFDLGLNKTQWVDTNNLLADINANTDAIRTEVAQHSITILSQGGMKASRTDYAQVPLTDKQKKVAYIAIGTKDLNDFGKRMKSDFGADVFYFSYNEGKEKADEIVKEVQKDGKYDAVVIGVHNYSLRPANNFGLTAAVLKLYKDLNFIKTITLTFGNVLATKNFCDAYTLVACYQDDAITQQAAADLLQGKIKARGILPVTVCQYKFGDGIVYGPVKPTKEEIKKKLTTIDSIALDGITKKAFPGCVVLAAHKGEIIYHKAFGNYEFDPSSPMMSAESIFDLASVTKISATTVAIMKMYEEGLIELDKTIGDYLPWTKGTDKAKLTINDILLHQAGLHPFIVFYKETIDVATGIPKPGFYSDKPKPGYTVKVAENMYMRNDWQDTMWQRILKSPLTAKNKYVYSDNDFIFLGRIIQEVSGLTLDQYTKRNFYDKIGMMSTGFNPTKRFSMECLVPTETEKHFRQQTARGYVHDEGASMFGGVSGHAGLFSNAYDLSLLYQMLLNGGVLNGERYLKAETVKAVVV